VIRYEIDEIERFSSAKKLYSYAGLIPSTYSSGERIYHGRITKQGNKYLRWAMTEAAQVAAANSSCLRRYYVRIKSRKGSNAAIIALARKLLGIVYCIWNESEDRIVKWCMISGCPLYKITDSGSSSD
jgi:transposase